MTQHAKEFVSKLIKEKELEEENGYENITVRIDRKEWAMLSILTKYFNLKTNSVFTEILGKEIHDMVKNLTKDDLNEFREKIKIYHHSSGAKALLLKSEIIDPIPIFDFMHELE